MVHEDDMTIMEPGEFSRAVDNTLSSLGLSLVQLREQAERGEFSSVKAEAIWWVISDESEATQS